ncbi:unnamed protein product [Adineta ricciae]|nr:unnamed protein product [Adineta ricciae]
MKNQDETDVDCGGTKCPKCRDTKNCTACYDCISGICRNNMCIPNDHCLNKITDNDETDIDCGGLQCPKCGDMKNCNVSADCINGSCINHKCIPAESCTDNVKNQDETDVDCGGTICTKCGSSKSCTQASDCSSGYCDSNHVCSNPTVATTPANPTTPSPAVSVTTSVSTSNYYGTESISLRPSTILSNVIIVVTVQKTVGAKWTGMFNNFPGGSMTESHDDNGAQVTYTWRSTGGLSIGSVGGSYTATAQFDLIGTAQPTTGDTYNVTITTDNGQTSTQLGHF